MIPFDRFAISSGFRKEDEEAAHRAGVAPWDGQRKKEREERLVSNGQRSSDDDGRHGGKEDEREGIRTLCSSVAESRSSCSATAVN